jgi:PKD-like domain/Secretion system C-terminal sorting domain
MKTKTTILLLVLLSVFSSLEMKGKGCNAHYTYTGDSLYCPGELISFTFRGYGLGDCYSSSFNWYRNGVLLPNNSSGILVVNDTGTYYGKLGNRYSSRVVHIKYLSSNPLNIIGSRTICAGVSTTYSLPNVNGAMYNWILPQGWSGNSTTNSINLTANSSGILSVGLSTDCGNYTVQAIQITVQNPMPSVLPNIVGPSSACIGLTSSYSIAPILNATSYYWTIPNSWTWVSGYSTNVLTTIAGSAGGTITVRGYNSCGSTPIKSMNVLSQATLFPSVNITSSSNYFCDGSSVSFLATASNTGASSIIYNWELNGIIVQSGNNNTFIGNNFETNDVVKCTIATNGVCVISNTTSNAITLTKANGMTPTVSISLPSSSICAGSIATLTATTTCNGNLSTYNWMVNGVSLQNNTNNFFSNGNFSNGDTVSCVMTSNLSCLTSTISETSNQIPITVLNYESILVSLTSSATNICRQTPVTFTASATNEGTAPIYNFMVNGYSRQNTGSNIFTYNSLVSNSTVNCVITSNQNCLYSAMATSNDISMIVTPAVFPWAYISILSGHREQCFGDLITFSVNAGDVGINPLYEWTVNGVSTGNTGSTFSSTTLSNADVVRCIVTPNGVCSLLPTYTTNPITMILYENTIPTINIAIQNGTNSLCAGTSKTFVASISYGGINPFYQWQVDGGDVGTNSRLFTTSALTDSQVVTCLLTSSFSCAGPSTITSNAIPITILTNTTSASNTISLVSGSAAFCPGTTLTFSATPVNGNSYTSYQWKIGSSNVGTNSSVFTFNPISSYLVSCVMSSTTSCPSNVTSNQISITPYQKLTPSVSIILGQVSTTSICQGNVVTFNASAINGGSSPAYQWKVDGANEGTNGPVFTTNSLSNNQMVTCLMTSGLSCTNYQTASSNGIRMNVSNQSSAILNINSCGAYTLNSQTYTSSGTHTQTLTNANGCDSILTLNLTITNPTNNTINQMACGAYTLNSQTYTSSGTYTQTLTNAAGCDSVLTINLTITNLTSSTITNQACNSYTLNSQTYTSSGTYTQTLTNATGCVSVLTINLTITNPTSATINQTDCGSYTLNSQTYTSSGTYTQTLTNSAGCDSVLTINLTITNPTSSTITTQACNSYTFNSQTYTSSGTYTQTLTSAAGCDSVLTINLTITNPTSSTITTQACNSYTFNSQTYTSSGTYTQTLTSAAGCDSLITFNLTIDTIDVSVTIGNATIFANQNGATYQWLDCNNNFVPIQGENNQSITGFLGDCAVEITLNGCVDTSACVNLFSTEINQVVISNEDITIFPNPTTNNLSIKQLNNLSIKEISIYNVLGELVMSKVESQKSKELVIDVSALMKGIYIVEVSIEQGVVRKKLVKE